MSFDRQMMPRVLELSAERARGGGPSRMRSAGGLRKCKKRPAPDHREGQRPRLTQTSNTVGAE